MAKKLPLRHIYFVRPFSAEWERISMEFFRNHGRNMTEDQNIGFYLEVDLGREADGRTDI